MKLSIITVAVASMMATSGWCQEEVQETFTGTRILNGHSTETLKSRVLQFRISHRFGDMAGANGGIDNFFGFDQAADIRFAFEYGITDKLMVGFARCKGTGAPYAGLLDGFVKYRLLTQTTDNKMPVSMSVLGTSSMTYAKAVEDLTLIQSYPEFAHRMAYSAQLVIARKFGERVSVALLPTYVHRNLVNNDDVNGLFALGTAVSVKLTKEVGLIGEYYPTFHEAGLRTNLTNSLSGGVEWTTHGHDFKVVLTNSRGFGETQFIPYTYSRWIDTNDQGKKVVGQFRIGFTITRNFKL